MLQKLDEPWVSRAPSIPFGASLACYTMFSAAPWLFIAVDASDGH